MNEISRQIFGKYANIKFHENPSGERRVVPFGQTDGRTGMTKVIAAFLNFANAPKKRFPIQYSQICERKLLLEGSQASKFFQMMYETSVPTSL